MQRVKHFFCKRVYPKMRINREYHLQGYDNRQKNRKHSRQTNEQLPFLEVYVTFNCDQPASVTWVPRYHNRIQIHADSPAQELDNHREGGADYC